MLNIKIVCAKCALQTVILVQSVKWLNKVKEGDPPPDPEKQLLKTYAVIYASIWAGDWVFDYFNLDRLLS